MRLLPLLLLTACAASHPAPTGPAPAAIPASTIDATKVEMVRVEIQIWRAGTLIGEPSITTVLDVAASVTNGPANVAGESLAEPTPCAFRFEIVPHRPVAGSLWATTVPSELRWTYDACAFNPPLTTGPGDATGGLVRGELSDPLLAGVWTDVHAGPEIRLAVHAVWLSPTGQEITAGI